MKKLLRIFMIVLLGFVLLSCGQKVNIPDIESSGYDISPAINPLNASLDDHTKQIDTEEVMDEFENYMSSYPIMTNANEIFNLNHMFMLTVGVAQEEYVEAIRLEFVIVFADLDMNQAIYEDAEMMFLQMRQDIDNETDYPVALTLSYSFNDGDKATFNAVTDVNKKLNGFAKQIYLRNSDLESSQYDSTFLDNLLTEGYAEYYQKQVLILMTFSDGNFFIKYQPRDKTYSIYSEKNISAEDFMADYIEGYDKVAWDN